MGTGPLASRTTQLIKAEVTFCGLNNRSLGHRIPYESANLIPHLDHTNIVVGTRIGTGRASNAGIIVDDNLAAGR